MKAGQYEALLSDVAQAGVYHEPHGDGAALLHAAEAAGFATFRVDLRAARGKDDLLAVVAEAMAFPSWFGHNWDALLDCLTDLAWRPADGYVVRLEHCDAVHVRAEAEFTTLLRVFADAADQWREQDTPLWCFVDLHADGSVWLPTIP